VCNAEPDHLLRHRCAIHDGIAFYPPDYRLKFVKSGFDLISSQRKNRMTRNELIELADLMNGVGLVAQGNYATWAGHGGQAVPEHFMQSELYRHIAIKFGDAYDIRMEARMSELNLPGQGRADIAISESSENQTARCIIEIKRGFRINGFSNDYGSLQNMRHQIYGLKAALFVYSSFMEEKNLIAASDNLRRIVNAGNIRSSSVFNTYGRNGAPVFYQSHVLLVPRQT
jgi:hypothetical protein